MIDYRLTTAVIAMLLGTCLLWLVRRHHLHGPYAVWWIAVALAIGILGVFPALGDAVAQLLGVTYSPILVVVLGLGAILLKMLLMDIDRTRHERSLRRLTQRLAILEATRVVPRRAATKGRPQSLDDA